MRRADIAHRHFTASEPREGEGEKERERERQRERTRITYRRRIAYTTSAPSFFPV